MLAEKITFCSLKPGIYRYIYIQARFVGPFCTSQLLPSYKLKHQTPWINMLTMHTKTTHKACNYIMAVYTLTRPFPLCLEVCSSHAQDLFHTHAHFIHCDYLYLLRKWQTEIIIMVSSFHSSLPTYTHTHR